MFKLTSNYDVKSDMVSWNNPDMGQMTWEDGLSPTSNWSYVTLGQDFCPMLTEIRTVKPKHGFEHKCLNKKNIKSPITEHTKLPPINFFC